ncbi:hypothetical protein [Nocardioides renjunii]|uniref:hypothetical protein n=1 Tax=Nocardioides renjunii TaxID=3095075 RepID=UPI002AFE7AFC|nr:hypothetical protein [Nocardioides sp. S-34]WQQ21678.1 hypothetical protein SHK17_17500 [Nocardioides sp. S-34]
MVDRSPEWVVSGLLTLFSGRHLMHVRRALAAALAVPLLLAGCSEDKPEPKMPDPPPTSTSPTDEPTETETAEAESAEGFIRRWVKAGDEMQVTGETDEYDAMTPDCAACQSFVASVADVYAEGGSAKFAGSKIVQVKRVGDEPPTFDLTKELPETRIIRGDGTTETLPGGRTTIRVTLGKKRGEWVVTHFGIL